MSDRISRLKAFFESKPIEKPEPTPIPKSNTGHMCRPEIYHWRSTTPAPVKPQAPLTVAATSTVQRSRSVPPARTITSPVPILKPAPLPLAHLNPISTPVTLKPQPTPSRSQAPSTSEVILPEVMHSLPGPCYFVAAFDSIFDPQHIKNLITRVKWYKDGSCLVDANSPRQIRLTPRELALAQTYFTNNDRLSRSCMALYCAFLKTKYGPYAIQKRYLSRFDDAPEVFHFLQASPIKELGSNNRNAFYYFRNLNHQPCPLVIHDARSQHFISVRGLHRNPTTKELSLHCFDPYFEPHNRYIPISRNGFINSSYQIVAPLFNPQEPMTYTI